MRQSIFAMRLLCLALVISSVSAVHAPCDHTFPDGTYFNLCPLQKPVDQKDWIADDRNGNLYYFNVAADANEVPEACMSLAKAVRYGPVFITLTFQVRRRIR